MLVKKNSHHKKYYNHKILQLNIKPKETVSVKQRSQYSINNDKQRSKNNDNIKQPFFKKPHKFLSFESCRAA